MNPVKKEYLPIRILHDFASRLEGLDIQYMLTGSMALAMYSIFRFTADVDIVIDLQQAKLSRLISALEPDYYVPHDAARHAVESKRMFNAIHHQTAYKVDCAIRKTGDFSESAFSRRQQTNFYGREIWIISKEDLILSKLHWASESRSEMQSRDIRALIKSGYDKHYVGEWVAKLGLSDFFKEIVNEETND